MGQIRHGSATTTQAVRAAIVRAGPPSVRGRARMIASFARAAEQGAGYQSQDRRKVAQAGDGGGLEDRAREPSSTVLTEAEEAMIVAFRRHTLLPLDDCHYALQPSLPHLTRSALHRCLQRNCISRLPDVEGGKPKRQRFKRYPFGFFRIDVARFRRRRASSTS